MLYFVTFLRQGVRLGLWIDENESGHYQEMYVIKFYIHSFSDIKEADN